MPSAAKSKPNILIFMTDQEQADVLRPDHPCRTANRSVRMEQPHSRWHTLPPDSDPQAARPRGLVRRPGWGDYTLYRTLPSQSPLGYDQGNDWKVVSAGLKALEELVKQPSDQPWCLYVGPVGPHDPFNVPDVFARRYDPTKVDLPASYHDSMADKPRIYQ